MVFRKKRKRKLGSRRFVRLKSYCLVKYQDHLDPETVRLVNAKNISEGGILISAKEQIPVLTPIKLTINIPHRGKPLEVLAKVMRCRKAAGSHAYDVGVAFVELSSTDREELADHISRAPL